MSGAPESAQAGHGSGHEERDLTLRPIVLAGAGLVLVLVFVAVAMFGLYRVFATREARLSPPQNALAAAEGPRLPPQPRLQVQPIRDLRELHTAEDNILEHYAWVDRAAGVVRIPIARAIELLAAKGGEAGGKSQ